MYITAYRFVFTIPIESFVLYTDSVSTAVDKTLRLSESLDESFPIAQKVHETTLLCEMVQKIL